VDYYNYNDRKDIDKLYGGVAQFRFYHQVSSTKNQDNQRKRIGTKGIIKKTELVPSLGTEL